MYELSEFIVKIAVGLPASFPSELLVDSLSESLAFRWSECSKCVGPVFGVPRDLGLGSLDRMKDLEKKALIKEILIL